jgi:hypothetical protein
MGRHDVPALVLQPDAEVAMHRMPWLGAFSHDLVDYWNRKARAAAELVEDIKRYRRSK